MFQFIVFLIKKNYIKIENVNEPCCHPIKVNTTRYSGIFLILSYVSDIRAN